MTRKDYQLIADALKSTQPGDDGQGIEIHAMYGRVVGRIADALRKDNNRFDYDRFYKACGIQTD